MGQTWEYWHELNVGGFESGEPNKVVGRVAVAGAEQPTMPPELEADWWKHVKDQPTAFD